MFRITQLHQLFQRTVFAFAKSRHLSKAAQKALWAETIMREIMKEPASIHSSLSARLLQLPNPSKKFSFDETCKDEVLSLFKNGVKLDPQVFRNDGICKGEAQSTSPFVFFPTYSVTQPIFKKLMDSEKSLLIEGGSGTGKSISIILFLQLSSFINSFKLSSQFCSLTKQEFRMLRSQKFFIREVPKYWYWSINSERDRSQENLMKLLTQQATELSDQQRKSLKETKSFTQFIASLRDMYPTTLTTKLVVDQAEVLFSLMKKWNISNKNKSDEEELKKPALDLRQKLSSLLSLSSIGTFVLNSASMVEQNILNVSNKDKDVLSLNLLDEQKAIDRFEVNQVQILEQAKGYAQFQQLFWFELEKHFKQLACSQQTLSDIRQEYKSLTRNIFKRDIPFFKNHRNVSIFFDENPHVLQNMLRSRKHIHRVFKVFQQFALWNYVEKFDKIIRREIRSEFQKEQFGKRYKLGIALLEIVEKQTDEAIVSDREEKNCQLFQVSRQKLDAYEQAGMGKLYSDLVQRDVYEGMLPFKLLSGGIIIQFPFSRTDFIYVMLRVLNPEFIADKVQIIKEEAHKGIRAHNMIKKKLKFNF